MTVLLSYDCKILLFTVINILSEIGLEYIDAELQIHVKGESFWS